MVKNRGVVAVIESIIRSDKQADIKISPIIENKSRGTMQYRTIIPKKFARIMNLNKNTHEVLFKLFNKGTPKYPDYELVAKIRKKNDKKI